MSLTVEFRAAAPWLFFGRGRSQRAVLLVPGGEVGRLGRAQGDGCVSHPEGRGEQAAQQGFIILAIATLGDMRGQLSAGIQLREVRGRKRPAFSSTRCRTA